MKIKTSELTDAALDWAAWGAAGGAAAYPKTASGPSFLKLWKGNTSKYMHPSTDWAQGGPIIERHITKIEDYGDCWGAEGVDAPEHFGPTPLIAALRCYVASKLGDEVDVPEELIKEHQP